MSPAARCLSVILIAMLLPACHSKGTSTAPTPTTPSTPSVVSVVITGASLLVGTGQTAQLSAVATLTGGTTEAVTSTATWQSSDSTIASVSAAGLVTVRGFGAVTITATFQGVSTTAAVTTAQDFSGTWSQTQQKSTSAATITLVLSQSALSVTGTDALVQTGTSPMMLTGAFGGTVLGATLSFSMTLAETGCQAVVTGTSTVSGTSMTFVPLMPSLSGPACDTSNLPAPNVVLVLAKQ